MLTEVNHPRPTNGVVIQTVSPHTMQATKIM